MEDEDWLMLSPNPADVWGSSSEVLNREVIQLAEEGRLDARDIDVALSLATFVHDEYEEYGTRGHNKLDDKDIALAQRALAVVLARVGIQFSLPWRDFSKFRSYWLKNAGYNSWQARRIILCRLLRSRLQVAGDDARGRNRWCGGSRLPSRRDWLASCGC